MTKPKLPNQKKAYKDLAKRLNGYTKKILGIYAVLAKKSALIVASTDYDGDGEFSFADYPQTSKKVGALLDYYSNNMQSLIYRGISEEWRNSNTLQDLLTKTVIKTYARKIGKAKQKSFYEHNKAAMKAFGERKVKGLGLSERIWNQRDDVKEALEKCLSTGIEKGMSAVQLSKKVSKYLNDYPLLAKDYKKKYGKATTIQNCEYRSVRLARNEINMAFRSAEQERWTRMDYIKGKEIKTTNNLNHKKDMCDLLAGVYPRDYYWVGWHVNCMCYAIPIIMNEEEYWSGKQPLDTMPEEFTDWVDDNKDKARQSSYITHYAKVRDTAKTVSIPLGLQRNEKAILGKKINEWASKNLKEIQINDKETAKRLYLFLGNREIIVNKKFLTESLAKNINNARLTETIQVAMDVKEWLPKGKFVRKEPGKHHDCFFNVYQAEHNGKKIEFKTKLTDGEILYTMRLLN